ncbi:MAG: divergent PAP2 family protein [Clostridia bacterium]|nr:divergent PAP2 family protein [Clostridia bacterium]
MSVVLEILNNRFIQAGFLAWAIAQGLKVVLTLIITREFDKTRMWGSGGMPSSHSSTTCALMMIIGFSEGFDSALFALAFAFSAIVMYDAAGVRRSTGKNAAVINRLIDDLYQDGSFKEEHLKELVGHTPIQVLAGALLGVFVGTLLA